MGISEKIKDFLQAKGAAREKQKSTLLEWYQGVLRQAGLKFDALHWIVFGLILSIIASIIASLTITIFLPKVSIFLSLIILIVALDLFLGYPYLKAQQQISEIEEALPNALKQMADVLKAGGTYEAALRQVATSDYGTLTKEIELVLRKTEEGESLENSFIDLSGKINSRLVKRSVTVIIDTIKAGAGLADVLDDIADDIRAMNRIQKERTSETLLQVIFMVASGAFIAPAIFGLVSTIINLFITAAASLKISEPALEQATHARDTITTLIQIYIFIEIIANACMMSLMRNGRIGKAILYFPILLLIAYTVYYSSVLVSELVLGGIS